MVGRPLARARDRDLSQEIGELTPPESDAGSRLLLKLQIARTQSRPPNSRRFDSKQNAFAAIEENRLIQTIAAQAPAEQGPQG